MSLEKCLIHIENNEGVFDRKTREKIFSEIMAMNQKELNMTESQIMKKVQEQIKDGIDKTTKYVHDTIKIKRDKDAMFVDRVTGKPLTTLKQVLKQQRDELVGRNSADTQVRRLRNRLVNDFDSLEYRFRANENPNYKSLREIKEGSDEEKYVFKKVDEFTEELTPEMLTKEKIDGLLKKYPNELDRIALAMVAYNGHARNMANSYGMAVKFNKNYVMKRRYDIGAINRMFGEDHQGARIKFADYMLTKLDLEATFPGHEAGKAKALLVDLYDKLVTSNGARTSVLNPDEFSSDKANSLTRSLIYKNSDTRYDVFRDLSVGGLRDQFDRNAKSLAGNIMRIHHFGYDSDRVMSELFTHMEAKVGKNRSNTEHALEYQIMQARKELLGQQNMVQTGLTDVTNAIKFTQGALKLHKAVVSAMMDVMETNRQIFFNEGKMFGGITGWLSNFAKITVGMSDVEKQQLANDLGVVFHYYSSGESMRMAQGDLATTGSKMTEWIQTNGGTVMKFTTLLPQQTGISKLTSALEGAQSITRIIDGKTDNKFSKHVLDTYKISPAEAKLLAKAEKVTTWGSPILTGKSVRDSLEKIGIENVAKELGIEPKDVPAAWLGLADKIEMYQNDFNVRGTPTPELMTKSAIPGRMSDSERLRSISSIVTQFMDTPIAQAQNFVELAKKVHQMNDGSIPGMTADFAPYLAMYSLMSTSMYLAFEGAYSMAFNKPSLVETYLNGTDEQRRRAMFTAMDRASPIPFIINMYENQTSDRYNQNAMSTFSSGPVMGLLSDTLDAVKNPTSDDKDWGKDLGKFVKKQGPQRIMPVKFVNNWLSENKL